MKIVMHDDKRWAVLRESTIDDEPFYDLGRGIGLQEKIVARVSECEDAEPFAGKKRTRRIKDEGFVLETTDRTMMIRKARSSKRYPVSLAGIYSAAVKAAVSAERIAKAKAKGKFTVKRGSLRR